MFESGQTTRRQDRPKVVIADYDFGDVEIERNILEDVGAEVVALQSKREEDLFEVAPSCAAMMNQYARIGRETISRMQKCEVIARYGVGVDIVDIDAATQKGILVTNVLDYCTEEVADHAISLWLALARKLPDYNRATHKGRLAMAKRQAHSPTARPHDGRRIVWQDRPGDCCTCQSVRCQCESPMIPFLPDSRCGRPCCRDRRQSLTC